MRFPFFSTLTAQIGIISRFGFVGQGTSIEPDSNYLQEILMHFSPSIDLIGDISQEYDLLDGEMYFTLSVILYL